jgi:hypothetical protein
LTSADAISFGQRKPILRGTQEHSRKSSQLPGCLRSTVFELESEVATVAAAHFYVFFFCFFCGRKMGLNSWAGGVFGGNDLD